MSVDTLWFPLSIFVLFAKLDLELSSRWSGDRDRDRDKDKDGNGLFSLTYNNEFHFIYYNVEDGENATGGEADAAGPILLFLYIDNAFDMLSKKWALSLDHSTRRCLSLG